MFPSKESTILKKMKKVFSIDCGLKNLAFCALDLSEPENPRILAWEVVDLCPTRMDDLSLAVVRCLDQRKEAWSPCDTIMIERQPSRNRKMTIVQHVIHAYFMIRGQVDAETVERVQIVSAVHKLGSKGRGLSGKRNYRERKVASVAMAREWLKENGQDKRWVDLFESASKKDDLADALNQALRAPRSTNQTREPDVPPNLRYRGTRARKPTDAQERRGFSVANVAWFFRESPLTFAERLESRGNAKWKKAVTKWFGSAEEVASTFGEQKSDED